MVGTALRSISCEEAWARKQRDPRVLLVDIRASMEYLFVGHPVGAVHVPWIDEPDWIPNPHFLVDIRKLVLGGIGGHGEETDVPIILICRSGKRSKEAGQHLVEAGLRSVYYVDEGFEGDLDEHHHRSSRGGWRFRGLPWEQC